MRGGARPPRAQAFDLKPCLRSVVAFAADKNNGGCTPLQIRAPFPARGARQSGRCIATYGPGAGQRRVGNNAGSRFSSLGRKVAELLDCLVGREPGRREFARQSSAACFQ